jgi:hypothetical protein
LFFIGTHAKTPFSGFLEITTIKNPETDRASGFVGLHLKYQLVLKRPTPPRTPHPAKEEDRKKKCHKKQPGQPSFKQTISVRRSAAGNIENGWLLNPRKQHQDSDSKKSTSLKRIDISNLSQMT